MILDVWKKLSSLPGGKLVFSRALSLYVPYTGSLRPRIRELGAGHSRIELKDRRGVRNHLQSIHAVALMNLCEATSGLALVAGLPKGTRAILVGFQIEYLKKARGTLVGETDCEIPEVAGRQEYEVEARVRDEAGDIVCRARAKWLLDLERDRKAGKKS